MCRYGCLPGTPCCVCPLGTPKRPQNLPLIKRMRYHLKPILSVQVQHTKYRMAPARQIFCCKGPGRRPLGAQKITLDQTKEVPLETNSKWSGTSPRVQNGPCKTNCLLLKACQTRPKYGPRPLSYNWPRVNIKNTTWNQFQMKRYITHSIEWPMQDKLSAAKGLPDMPQIWTAPTFLQLTQSKHKEYHLKPIPNEELRYL